MNRKQCKGEKNNTKDESYRNIVTVCQQKQERKPKTESEGQRADRENTNECV